MHQDTPISIFLLRLTWSSQYILIVSDKLNFLFEIFILIFALDTYKKSNSFDIFKS